MKKFYSLLIYFAVAISTLVAQNGNVGIGTQNPTEKLHIYEGNIYIETTNPPASQPTLIFSNTGNIHAKSGLDIILDSDNSDPTNNSHFMIKKDGESVILFDVGETGRFAFGKQNNNDRVFVDLSAEDSKGFVLPQLNIPNLNSSSPVDGSDAIPDGMLVWNTNTTTGPGLVYWNATLTRWETIRSSAQPELWVEDAVGGELFPATLSHKVGIGTSAPDYDLDVAGNIGLNTYLYHNDNDNTYLHFLNNEIRLQAGGREFIRMNQTTGLMTVNNGSTNTNIQFKGGSDDYMVYMQGSTNRVGIGTNTPSGKPHVKNTDDSYLVYGTTGNVSAYNPEAYVGEVRLGAAWGRPGVYSSNQLELFSGNTGIIFGDNDVERMRLTAAGDLGIGISPSYNLHIYKTANASMKLGNSASYTDNKLYFGDGSNVWIGEPGVNDRLQLYSSTLAIQIGGSYGTSGYVLSSNGSTVNWTDPNLLVNDNDWSRDNANGELYPANINDEVGIGTSDPAYPFHVTLTRNGDWQGRFTNGSSNVYLAHQGGYGMHINTGGTNSSGRYALEVRNANQTHLYVRDDGNVGIGTTGPAERLSVYPDQDISAEIGRAHIGYMGHGDWAGFSHIDANGTGSYGLLQNSAGMTLLNANSGQSIGFRINNTQYMTMESTGILDIDKGVRFDCPGCGSASTLNGTSDWGDLTIQGRVLSTNSNLHLSPPGGFGVIINDSYRAAGGGSGTVFLDVDGYVTVGNPATPSTTPGGYWANFYSTGDEGFSGWVWNNACGSAGWNVIYSASNSQNNAAVYDNLGGRSYAELYSPWIWIPSGIPADPSIWLHFYNSLEGGYDGAYLEYQTHTSGWTKITSFSQGGYNNSVNGSNSVCSGSNYQSAWSNSGWTLAQSTLTRSGTYEVDGRWIRFRIVGMEDASVGDGVLEIYRMTLEGYLPASGGSFTAGNLYAEKNVYAGSNVLMGDIAEYFRVIDKSEPGMLISLDPDLPDRYRVTSKANDYHVLGIQSTNPTLTLNDPNSGSPVALRGRVPVKVCGQNGPIRPGDMLTSSDTRGHAMKANGPAYVVGRALEYFNGEGNGEILCLIESGWYNPGNASQLATGTFKIMKNSREIVVNDPAVSEDSKIFVSLLGDPGARYWISDKRDGKFTINLSGESTDEVDFDYMVENAREADGTELADIESTTDPEGDSGELLYDASKGVYYTAGPDNKYKDVQFMPARQFDPNEPAPPVPADPTKMYRYIDGQVVEVKM